MASFVPMTVQDLADRIRPLRERQARLLPVFERFADAFIGYVWQFHAGCAADANGRSVAAEGGAESRVQGSAFRDQGEAMGHRGTEDVSPA